MNLNPKTLFLIDGLGALLSAFLLGILLVRFESIFGMPAKVLYFLSLIAFFMAVYSISNHFLAKQSWKIHMKILAFVNLQYCCLTGILMFYFYKELTTLGLVYFLSEVVIIVTLAFLELRTALK